MGAHLSMAEVKSNFARSGEAVSSKREPSR
jgi:hypothetical protein